MVAIINNGSSLYGALVYNMEKVEEGTASIFYTNKIIQNVHPDPNRTLHYQMKSFEPYLTANLRTKEPIAHISINPAPEDNLSDEKLLEIALDYLDKMGYKDQPYVMFKHMDIDRHHLHVVTTRLGEDGKLAVKNFRNWQRNQEVCRELEQKYGLTQVGGVGQVHTLYHPEKVYYKKGDVKKQISNTLKSLLSTYQFQSLGEWNALLSCYNIHVDYVKGEREGIPYQGMIYSALDEKGERKSRGLKASLFGKDVGFENLNKLIGKHKTNLKTNKIPVTIKHRIIDSLKKSRNMQDFKDNLEKNNMDIVFRTNDEGRIYGVTFIDHNLQLACNGSRLGKEFSANTFQNLFTAPSSLAQQTPEPQQTDLFEEYFTDWVDELFGTFNIQYHGEDLEFEFRKRKKKKKTRRRKL